MLPYSGPAHLVVSSANAHPQGKLGPWYLGGLRGASRVHGHVCCSLCSSNYGYCVIVTLLCIVWLSLLTFLMKYGYRRVSLVQRQLLLSCKSKYCILIVGHYVHWKRRCSFYTYHNIFKHDLLLNRDKTL